MTPVVKDATPGKWLDCSTPLSGTVLSAIRTQHPDVVGIVRSVPLPRNNTSGEVTAPELSRILDAGFESMWYQRVRGTQATEMLWVPSEHDGQEDAATACHWAHEAGYPDGVHGFQDLEGTHDTPANVLGYCMSWGRAAYGTGFMVGLYTGFASGLSPEQLYSLPAPNSYWLGFGGPSVATRGHAMRQTGTIAIAGVNFDVNVLAPDFLGGLPKACAKAAVA